MEHGRDIDALLIVFVLLFPITPPEAFPSYGKVNSNVKARIFRPVKGTLHAMTVCLGIEEPTLSFDPDYNPRGSGRQAVVRISEDYDRRHTDSWREDTTPRSMS